LEENAIDSKYGNFTDFDIGVIVYMFCGLLFYPCGIKAIKLEN